MELKEVGAVAQKINQNISRVLVGKKPEIDLVLTCLFAGGHALLDDVPGTGKTVLAKSLARSLQCDFKRIQFTADLLPSDITGLSVFNQKTGEFDFQPGPAFTNILLADEITVTQNAALTAQAAVILTQTHTKSSLFQKPCLILGWGRIAKALARLLSGWGAQVTVLARSPAARAEADSWGLAALRPDEKPGPFSFVFNTVPAQVLVGEALESLGPDCLWVELASRPYGLCPEDRARVRQLFAGNLPGRILPVSAAEILYRGIRRQLEGGTHGG